jgi:phenylacetate-CoA ligase
MAIREEYLDPQLEMMPPGEREEYFDQKVRWVAQYAFDNTPANRNRFEQAGIDPSQIRGVKDLEKIPPITRDEIVELQSKNPPFGGLCSIEATKAYWIFYSPGPAYVPVGSPEEVDTAAKAAYAAGVRRGDIAMVTLPTLFIAGPAFEAAFHRIGGTVVPTGPGNTELQVQIMHDLCISTFWGTPSFLASIIDRAEKMGYDFCKDFALRNALVSTEKLSPSLRKRFEQDYGINVTDILGSGFVGLLGYECREKSGFHVAEEIWMEVVDPTTGKQLGPEKVGELALTYFSKTFPLIRYRTGDLSSYTNKPCPCGRTSPRLSGILGRVGESAKVRGLFLVPRQLEEAMSDFPQVSRFQVILSRENQKDMVTLQAELKEGGSGVLAKAIEDKVQNLCRVRLDKIEFLSPSSIPEEHKVIVDNRVWQ